MKKKLLFLDFDGVMTSYEDGSILTSTPDRYGPSLKICDRIRRICDKTGARIIISSNWRRFDVDGIFYLNGKNYKNPLNKVYELLGDYIDGTLCPSSSLVKAEALILFLEENEDIGQWMIVDDDPNEKLATTHDHGINKHYLQTNGKFGLTEDDVKVLEFRLS